MGRTSRIILGGALCLLGLVPPLGLAPAHAVPLQPSVQWVAVEGASITYERKDEPDQVIKALGPAQSTPDIPRRSADATVDAILASVDRATTCVQVGTPPSARCRDARPQAGVERNLLWTMVAQGDAMAEEMTCSKDDGTHCLMAKDAHGDEVEVRVAEVKAGEKLLCTEQRDRMRCQKAPRELQHDAMQKR